MSYHGEDNTHKVYRREAISLFNSITSSEFCSGLNKELFPIFENKPSVYQKSASTKLSTLHFFMSHTLNRGFHFYH